jgi:ribose 5-phosphate isomerase B
MRVLIASDHAGVDLKAALVEALPDIDWEDLGPLAKDSVDYPDFADKVAQRVQRDPSLRGVLICGSGQGMAMRANKYANVRAALVWNDDVARLSRQHNDANVLVLPGRFVSAPEGAGFVRLFLGTAFEGGRHAARVQKISRSVED